MVVRGCAGGECEGEHDGGAMAKVVAHGGVGTVWRVGTTLQQRIDTDAMKCTCRQAGRQANRYVWTVLVQCTTLLCTELTSRACRLLPTQRPLRLRL